MSDAGAPAQSTFAVTLAARVIDDFDLRRRARPVIGVAGESGSGKSTTATGLAAALSAAGLRTAVIHQDDYFHRPPATNHMHRLVDLAHVGPQEVDLERLGAHITAFRAGRDGVEGPSVDYPNNRFLTRTLDFSGLDVLVVEGTYVLQLDGLDVRIFLEATHADTSERRRLRGRDIIDPVIDQILEIEHAIIVRQAAVADLHIDRDFSIRPRSR